MTTLLVVALAAVAVVFVLRKRYDSNLPLLFYFAAVVLTNMTDREIHPILLYSGLRGRIALHYPLALLFLVFWIGTFVTGVFFLPHTP